MPVSALLLALAAACLHALWNLLLARRHDVEAATAVALLVASVAFAPAALLAWDVERGAIPFLAATAALELAYFALLAAAYRRAELSLVYPLARGLAPVFVLAVAAALSHEPGGVQIAGVLVVALGVVLVRGARRPGDTSGTLFAVAVAACIAGYTVVDNEGVEHAAPLSYLEVALTGPALVYAAAVLRAKGGAALRAEAGAAAGAAGVAMFGAYALVLAALERAPAAPVAAVRETSVVFAALLAAPILGERVTRARIAGSVLVAAGVAVLAWA